MKSGGRITVYRIDHTHPDNLRIHAFPLHQGYFCITDHDFPLTVRTRHGGRATTGVKIFEMTL